MHTHKCIIQVKQRSSDHGRLIIKKHILFGIGIFFTKNMNNRKIQTVPSFSTCAIQCFSQENRWHKWKIKSHLAKPSCFRRFFSQGNNETRPNWPLIRKKKQDSIKACKAVSYGGTKGRLLKACYYKLFRRHRVFLCVDRKERRRGWGSYMKWDLQISTQPIMGSYGWRGHWGAVDFPSWERDIITLGVATQKSPSSVPRLVSANYKTQSMTFTHEKKTFAVFFFIIWVQSHSLRYNFGPELFCYPLITSHIYNIVKTYQNTHMIVCAI